MTRFDAIARFFVLFMAVGGFLFGQLFAGHFALGASLAGASGLVVGACAGVPSAQRRRAVVLGAGLGTLGVVLDVWQYYTELDIPGNYYAWFLIGPFTAALWYLAMRAVWSAAPEVN